MKRKLHLSALVLLICIVWAGCKKDEKHEAIPIAPLLKEVVFPSENDVMPGREATIRGKGFAAGDKVWIENTDGMTEVEVLETTNDYLKILVPADAAGKYVLTLERAGLQSTLDGELSVPYIVVIDNLVMPTASFGVDADVLIQGEGFQTGDVIQLNAGFYAQSKTVTATTATAEGITFKVPAGSYGINSVMVLRGERKAVLGNIGIEANVGDEIGGGVVFYTETNKLHGYIVSRTNTGTATEKFGPGVVLSGAAGTSKAVGAGKDNTAKLVAKMVSFRQGNSSWNSQKAAAELCDELSVTWNNEVYTDWYLPSQQELIELFKVKDMLWNKNAGMPPNNYWSSSEGDGDAAGWSAYYVNFYEATNIVTGNSDKEIWKIGIRAIRSF